MPNRSPGTVVSSPAVENLEVRQLMTANYAVGINLNDSAAATVGKVTPVLKALNVKTLRLWASVSDFNNHTLSGVLQRAIDYSSAGFDITLEVESDNGKMQSPSAVAGWFQWAMSNPTLRNAVDHWEIGNEPDHYAYWQGTLGQYVNDFLAPAYNVLHAYGEEVISAGPSYNAQDVQTMIDNGMLNYCDYVGFHPYANGVSGVKKSVAAINAVVAGRKPIAATEWNVRGFESDKTSWANAITEAYPYIKNGFDLNYYFALKVQNSKAGPGGILTTSFAANQPFYNAFATFTGASATPPSSGSGGENTPSSNTGKITGTLWDDLNGNGSWDDGETATGVRKVFIDSNADGKLDDGEKSTTSNASGAYTFSGLYAGTYKVTRQFPSGFHLSNSTTGYVAATVTSGKTTSGVNIGSTKTAASSTPIGSAPAVTGFQLIDTTTNKVIATYKNITKNMTIPLESLPSRNLAILAIGGGSVNSMKLTALGKTIIENNAPYAFFTDDHGVYASWYAVKGSQTLTATAYSADNAAGTKGNTLSVTLNFA